MEPHVNDITEEMLAQYLDFLRNELEYAPTTIWSCFSKVNTKYQDIDGLKLQDKFCLLYTSPSPRDGLLSRMPSSA